MDFDLLASLSCTQLKGAYLVSDRENSTKWKVSFTEMDKTYLETHDQVFPYYKATIKMLKYLQNDYHLKKVTSYGIKYVMSKFSKEKYWFVLANGTGFWAQFWEILHFLIEQHWFVTFSLPIWKCSIIFPIIQGKNIQSHFRKHGST